jgi:hypothetical protein
MTYKSIYLPVGPLASFIRHILYISSGSSLEFSSLLAWLARRFRPILSSSIIVNRKLFEDISSTIALKDRGFVGVSSRLSSWAVEMKAQDEIACSKSWILLYRASLSNFKASEFHRACDGMGKFVVVVKAENGSVAISFNEDGFNSDYCHFHNLNGLNACVDENGGCGEIIHRTDKGIGIFNDPGFGPVFGEEGDLAISNNCNQNEYSCSILGASYGEPGVDEDDLFGQESFRVADYEVFKIVIE